MLVEPRKRRDDVVHARGDRDRHGHHVVDHQRGGDHHARTPSEVPADDFVGSAAARVGVDHLTIGEHHDDHQEHHGKGDPRGQVQVGQSPEGQHLEDLLGGVGDRGQRVGGEDGQGDPLGQQGLAQIVAAHRASDQYALDGTEFRHHANDARETGVWAA